MFTFVITTPWRFVALNGTYESTPIRRAQGPARYREAVPANPLDALRAALPPPPGSLGFIKKDVPRCTTQKKDGTPCMAPRKRGSLFCANHKWMDEAYPAAPVAAPSAAAGRAVVPLGDRQAIAAEQRKIRKDVIAEMREVAEIDPKRIFATLFEGLTATLVIYDRASGDRIATEQPDWDVRFAAFDRIADRLYGKPKTRQEVSGPEGGPINIAAIVLDLAGKAALHEQAEKNGSMEDYYTSIPDEDVVDVGAGEVVDRPVV